MARGVFKKYHDLPLPIDRVTRAVWIGKTFIVKELAIRHNQYVVYMNLAKQDLGCYPKRSYLASIIESRSGRSTFLCQDAYVDQIVTHFHLRDDKIPALRIRSRTSIIRLMMALPRNGLPTFFNKNWLCHLPFDPDSPRCGISCQPSEFVYDEPIDKAHAGD